MGIIAKNIIVGNGEVKPSPEPMVKKETPVIFASIKREVIPEIIPEEPKYKTIKNGDLHRLYNTKSEYLKDMVSLEKQ